MCGILGFINEDLDSSIISFKSAIAKLGHRGPSSSSHIVHNLDNNILLLGHTRLSIIDLSESGNQPMSCCEKRYYIILNGEVYNYIELKSDLLKLGYKFKSNTDTEVLLYSWIQWKFNVLHKINGMFSFSILDKKYNTLYIIRDAFGIKPLYYFKSDNCFGFSSETSALLDLLPNTAKINWNTAYNYLTHARVDRGEHTFYDGVKNLLPGHYLKVDLNSWHSMTIKRWWYPSINENHNIPFKKSKEILRKKFLDSIKLQLRSDVPLGAALSGGIDSSAVVCAMRYLEPSMEINTFSYISKGSIKNEEKWIDIINDHVDAKSHKIEINKSNIFTDLEKLIKIQGEPFGSPSIYAQYRVFKKISESGVVVNLDGQGADELLAGYFGYPHARFESLIAHKDIFKILRLHKGLGKTFNQYPTIALLQAFSKRFSDNLVSKRAVQFVDRYLNRGFSIQFIEERITRNYSYNDRELSSCLRDALTGKRGLTHLLRYEDRNSMSHSIESRVPFLTIDMAEFLLSLPENYLLSDDGVTKYVFREAMRGIVPDQILDRKDKIGFETPDNQWLLAEKNTIIKWLKEFDQIPMLDSAKALLFYEHLCNGTNKDFLGFWRLINFYKWYEQNNF